jgi:uncharacterized iron-regulated protein
MSSRALALAIMFLTLTGAAQAHTTITRLSDRQTVSLAQLAAAAGSSDLVLIGEAHDQKNHHDMQLEIIRALFARGLTLAIGLEMLQADHQQQLDEWSAGRMSEPAMQEVFARNWSQDWQLYRGIFLFARDHHIPMLALNVPLAVVRKVSDHGFASLTPEERRGLPEGTSCDLSNPQIVLLRKTFQGVANHVNGGRVFRNFCEAQTVRNSGMAITMDRFRKGHPGRTIVALTGIWHAVKYAIPEQLTRYGSKLSYTVILPESADLNSDNTGTSEADYLVDR